MTIELTEDEREALLRLLRHELTEMPSEIRRTQTSTYRDALKGQEKVLRLLIERLSK